MRSRIRSHEHSAIDRAIAQVEHKLCEFLTTCRRVPREEARVLVSMAMEVDVRRTETGWCVQATLKKASLAEVGTAAG